MKVFFLLHQVGPYHHYRLQHFSRSVDLFVAEINPDSKEYDWNNKYPNAAYNSIQIHQDKNQKFDIISSLSKIKPDVIICTGWFNWQYHAAIVWAKQSHVPVIGISDSTFSDARRYWPLEKFKSFLVSFFDALLVAGSRSKAYAMQLGMNESAIFQPWDVVDNQHFKKNNESARQEIKLPENYLLCISRFIPKKNHTRLLQAFHAFKEANPQSDLKLVLAGSGVLKEDIEIQINEFHLSDQVELYDFVQYDQLPYFYQQAQGFILASTSDQWGLVINEAMAAGLPVAVSERCGCSEDLVEHKKNGYVFNSFDLQSIQSAISWLANLSDADKTTISQRNQFILSKFTIKAFSENTLKAIEYAKANQKKKSKWQIMLLQLIVRLRILISK